MLPGDLTLAFCALAFALPFGFFEWQRARQAGNISATDFVAGLFTFTLGAYAVRGSMALAAAAGVAAAAVLAERHVMHAFLKRLSWMELRAVLLLLVIWSFSRAYYFAFYVIEKYIDPSYRFSGLLSAAKFIVSRRR